MTDTHDLKIQPQYFRDVCNGTKTFEVRKDDRGYKVGDKLVLNEWSETAGCYTGAGIVMRVTYILSETAFVREGYVIMGITPWRETA